MITFKDNSNLFSLPIILTATTVTRRVRNSVPCLIALTKYRIFNFKLSCKMNYGKQKTTDHWFDFSISTLVIIACRKKFTLTQITYHYKCCVLLIYYQNNNVTFCL